MKYFYMLAVLCTLPSAPLLAQNLTENIETASVDPIIQIAVDSGVCGVAPVESAVMDPETNTITAVCGEDAEGFVPLAAAPLLGGLGAPMLTAIGLGAIVAASGGGGGPADTISQ